MRPRRILLVDDEPAELLVLERMLGEQGFEIRIAIDGPGCFQSVEMDPPDLILLDLDMPGTNGFQVCAGLKANRTTASIPILVLTASLDPADKAKGFELGAVDCIPKPFDPREVGERVRCHLRISSLERSLKRVERSMKHLERSSAAGTWYRDMQDETVFWSDETFRIFGVDPGTSESIEQILRRCLSQEDLSRLASLRAEHRGYPDGWSPNRRRSMAMNIKVSETEERQAVFDVGEPVFDEAGRPDILPGSIRLVDPDPGSVMRSRESARYKRILLDLADGFVLVDERGRILLANDSLTELTGIPIGGLIGESLSSLEAEEGALAAADWLRRGALTGRERFLTKIRTASGEAKDVEISIRVHSGPECFYSLFMRDLSPLIRREREVARAELAMEHSQRLDALGRLAAGVAHDFNNALGVVIGRISLAMEMAEGEPALMEHLRPVFEAARNSRGLTRKLLEFSKERQGVAELVDVNSCLGSLVAFLRKAVPERIDVEWIPEPDLWTLIIDPGVIDNPVTNLVINAKDSIQDSGTIRISARNVVLDEPHQAPGTKTREFVSISVTDDGCGMSREVLLHAMEPFFTTKSAGAGTGLGLASVNEEVRRAGGFVEIDSQPGSGTQVRLFFPRGGDLGKGSAPVAATSRALRILLVEDDDRFRNMLAAVLDKRGHAVVAASAEAEAVKLFESRGAAFDLVVTDVVMPESSGFDLRRRLKALCPGIRFIFMSGYAKEVEQDENPFESDDGFISKPFVVDDLLALISKTVPGGGAQPRGADDVQRGVA